MGVTLTPVGGGGEEGGYEGKGGEGERRGG